MTIAEAGLNESINPITAGKIIIKAVIERLKRQYLVPSTILLSHFKCLLPEIESSIQEVSLFMAVSDNLCFYLLRLSVGLFDEARF